MEKSFGRPSLEAAEHLIGHHAVPADDRHQRHRLLYGRPFQICRQLTGRTLRDHHRRVRPIGFYGSVGVFGGPFRAPDSSHVVGLLLKRRFGRHGHLFPFPAHLG